MLNACMASFIGDRWGILAWLLEFLLRTLFYADLWEMAPPFQSKTGIFSGTPICNSRIFQLKLVGAAAFVEPDANGRISVPASQRAAVGIEKRAVLLGMGEKFELWSEQAHHAQIRQVITDEDLSDGLLDLAL